MDTLIAELNRACIYTVPKHISYSAENFITKDAYYKAIGYEEEDGKIENTDSYLNKLNAYIRLYGAPVQFAEVDSFQNPHGPKEGLAWLAKFWNAVPANRYTDNALHSFLEMAGFGLYQRCKTQFEKLLHFIARDFLRSLKEGNPELKKPISRIRDYVESEKFKKEPDGLQLKSSTESDSHFDTQAFALLGNWSEANERMERECCCGAKISNEDIPSPAIFNRFHHIMICKKLKKIAPVSKSKSLNFSFSKLLF